MEVRTENIEVSTPGGTMPGFLARPADDGPRPAVLVIMEAFGLNNHIKNVTKRIAAEGYVALAPDVYYRGGKNRSVGYDQLPEAIALMQSLKDPEVIADLSATIAHLERQPFVRKDRVGITGFCMGGRISYLAACELPGKIKAAAPFYGGGLPIDKTEKLGCPVLAFFGEKDPWIPLETVDQLKRAAEHHGKKGVEAVVYPGADHGFFCDERASYQAEAARDSWERLKKLFAKHLQA